MSPFKPIAARGRSLSHFMSIGTEDAESVENPLWSRERTLALVAIVIVGGVVPLLITQHFGALGIPRNDDWIYIRAAFAFVDTGVLDGRHWIAATLVGQLVASVPTIAVFGHSVAALQVQT